MNKITWIIWMLGLIMEVLLCGMGNAQDTGEPQEVEEEQTEEGIKENPLVASAWCTFAEEREEDVENDEGEDTEDGTNQPNGINDTGCDIGLGLALYRVNNLSFVGVLGTKSLGVGLAFVVRRSPTVAVAIGFVVPYDSSGIYSNPRLAIGATLNFKGD